MKRLFQKIKHQFSEVIKIEKSPHSIASGFAVGTFIAVLYTPFLNILLALLVMLLYPKINKLSLIGAFIFWNPLFALPVYVTSYKLGELLFADVPLQTFNLVVLDQIYRFSRRFLIGNFILSIALSFVGYFVVRLVAELYQKKKHSKIRKKPLHASTHNK